MLRQSTKQSDGSSNRGSASTSTPASTSAPVSTSAPTRPPATPDARAVRFKAFWQAKSAKLERQTSDLSGNTRYKVRLRRLMRQLDLKAQLEHQRLLENKTIDRDGNIVKLAPCIVYSAADGSLTSWATTLAPTWSSALTGRGGRQDPSKARNVTRWLLAARANPEFQALSGELNTKIPADGEGIVANAREWAHSEVAAAADPNLDRLLGDALAKFERVVRERHPGQPVVIRDAMVAVWSEPNVMCCNACRFAVKEIGRRYAVLVTSMIAADPTTFRASSNQVTGTFVSARRQFGSQGVKYNDTTLKRIPPGNRALGGGHFDFEKVAREGKEGRDHPAYASQPDTPEQDQLYDRDLGEVETDQHKAVARGREDRKADKKQERERRKARKVEKPNQASAAARGKGGALGKAASGPGQSAITRFFTAAPATAKRGVLPEDKPEKEEDKPEKEEKKRKRVSDEEHETSDEEYETTDEEENEAGGDEPEKDEKERRRKRDDEATEVDVVVDEAESDDEAGGREGPGGKDEADDDEWSLKGKWIGGD